MQPRISMIRPGVLDCLEEAVARVTTGVGLMTGPDRLAGVIDLSIILVFTQ